MQIMNGTSTPTQVSPAEIGSFYLLLNGLDFTSKARRILHTVVNGHFSMNSQIRTRIKRGDFQHAFTMYQKLSEESLPIDEGTFLALLKACTDLKDVIRGSKIHVQIAERGLLGQHALIGNTLLNMYAKCGVFEKAQEVFDELPVRDVVSWNVLLGGLVKHELAEAALEWYEHMQVEGLSPDAVTYVCMLQACGRIGAVDKGRNLHAEIANKGLLKRNLIVGNALLDMYAKCGFPSKAHEVFDTLEIRDTISWNTLIAGYITDEQGEKALRCYQEMHCNDVSPNAVTFVCVVKACGLVRGTIQGQEIHAHISRHTLLQKNLVIGNSLVDMYAKWGWITKAREVFDKLAVRDLNSWNVMISGYAKLEYGEDALKCLEEMQHSGVIPDAVSFASSLKACGSMGNATKGKVIHSEIERRGPTVKNLIVSTALLNMYANCGWLNHAQEVFDGLLTRDLVSWNALIAGYVDNEFGKEALNCLEQMHREKISPNSVTYACSLKACGILRMPEKGCELHAEVSRKRLRDSDNLVGGALVDMYAKSGLVMLAQEVFDKLLVRDIVSWTALIMGYNDIGLDEEALMCLEQMQLEGTFSDGVLLACSLKACGSIRAVQRGKSLHAKFAETGFFEKDPVAGSALVDMYANCGLLKAAQMAFSRLVIRDIVSWNTLIAGYTRYERRKEVSKCVEEMGLEGIQPDIITLLCNLRVSFDVGALHQVKKILDSNVKAFEGNLLLSNTLVDTYAKLGWFSKALEQFDSLPARNNISWNALISGFAKHERNEDALDWLQQMQEEGILPDGVTFVSSLKACGSAGATDKGEELHVEIARRGLLKADVTVCNALMDMYAKSGWLSKAEEVFNNLLFRDVISWNVLISGHAQLGDNEGAFFLLDKMRREGQTPDSSTFGIILHACSQAALVKRGQLFFESMGKDFGIVPTCEHHTCMIDLFARMGNLHQAMFRIKGLPCRPDFIVWLTVLDACRKFGVHSLDKKLMAMHCIDRGSIPQPYSLFWPSL